MVDIHIIPHILKLGFEGLFYVTTLIFIVFSLSIIYHWFAYGIHKVRIRIMLVAYLGVSAVLFITMALSLNAL